MKITRGHYNRKLLAFGAMAFLAIALISTGFAAWIMSSGAETGFDDGNLTVGTITESDLEFTKIKITDGNTKLLLEPKKDDNKGDIKWDGTNYEQLTFTLQTTIAPVDYLDEVQMSLTFPASVLAAHQAGYIVLPESALLEEGEYLTIIKMNETKEPAITNHKGVTVTAQKVADENGTYIDISIKVEIKWGSVFGGENPSTYLDNTAVNTEGKKLSSDEKKAILYAFKKTVYGLDTTDESVIAQHSAALIYSMDLIATVN